MGVDPSSQALWAQLVLVRWPKEGAIRGPTSQIELNGEQEPWNKILSHRYQRVGMITLYASSKTICEIPWLKDICKFYASCP